MLKEISDETGMRGAKRFIPDLEKKLAAKSGEKPAPMPPEATRKPDSPAVPPR